MIQSFLQGITDYISSTANYYIDFQLLWYGFVAFLITLAATAVAWYFNVLKPVAGAIVAMVWFGLFAFRKGELNERNRRGD